MLLRLSGVFPLRKVLSPQSRVTVSMQCKNGSAVHVGKSTRPEANQQEIYSALGIRSHPGHAGKDDDMKQNDKCSAITTSDNLVTK